MAQVTFTVGSVAPKKRGTTNGRAWTLYEVRATDGRMYTTFDAGWSKQVGRTVAVEVAERNRLGAHPEERAPAANGQRPAPALAPDRFTVLVEKLDQVLAELRAIRRHFA